MQIPFPALYRFCGRFLFPTPVGACLAFCAAWLIGSLFLGGCSAVFDSTADVTLVDLHRPWESLWQLSSETRPRPTIIPTARFDKSGTPGFDLDTEFAQPLSPYVRGYDGQIYMRVDQYSEDGSNRTLLLYRVPAGDVAERHAIPHGEHASASLGALPLHWLLSAPEDDTQEGSVVLLRYGTTPLSVSIPAASRYDAHEGVLFSWPRTDWPPRTMHVVRFLPPDRLAQADLTWAAETKLVPGFLGAAFAIDRENDSFFYVTADDHMWAWPYERGPAADLGLFTAWLTVPGVYLMLRQGGSMDGYAIAQGVHFPLPWVIDPTSLGSAKRISDWVAVCRKEGLFSIDLSPLPALPITRVIDPRPCSALSTREGGIAHYYVNSSRDGGDVNAYDPANISVLTQYSAPLDGNAPPTLIPSTRPLASRPFELARCEDGLRAYSMEMTSGEHARRDGWVGDYRFSDDVSDAQFSRDCSRIRWREPVGAGSYALYSAALPRGPRLRLARNVGAYFEQPDGRILTQSNRTGFPDQTRLLLVDERSRTAYWLLDDVAPVVSARMVAPMNELLVNALVPTNRLGSVSIWARLPLPPSSP